jgi:hypothetical protein
VHELRVVRLEQLGELLARVVDEIGERLQAGEDDQVPGLELPPQLIARHGRVDDDVQGRFPFCWCPCGNAAGTITDFAHLKASA